MKLTPFVEHHSLLSFFVPNYSFNLINIPSSTTIESRQVTNFVYSPIFDSIAIMAQIIQEEMQL